MRSAHRRRYSFGVCECRSYDLPPFTIYSPRDGFSVARIVEPCEEQVVTNKNADAPCGQQQAGNGAELPQSFMTIVPACAIDLIDARQGHGFGGNSHDAFFGQRPTSGGSVYPHEHAW